MGCVGVMDVAGSGGDGGRGGGRASNSHLYLRIYTYALWRETSTNIPTSVYLYVYMWNPRSRFESPDVNGVFFSVKFQK